MVFQVTMWASDNGNENGDISVIEESCVEVDPDFTEYMQSSHTSGGTTILTSNVATSSGIGISGGVDLSDPKQLAELAKCRFQRPKPQVKLGFRKSNVQNTLDPISHELIVPMSDHF